MMCTPPLDSKPTFRFRVRVQPALAQHCELAAHRPQRQVSVAPLSVCPLHLLQGSGGFQGFRGLHVAHTAIDHKVVSAAVTSPSHAACALHIAALLSVVFWGASLQRTCCSWLVIGWCAKEGA